LRTAQKAAHVPVDQSGYGQPERRLSWGLLRTRMRQRGKHGDHREETESLAHGSSSETTGGSGERPRQNSLRGMISCRRIGAHPLYFAAPPRLRASTSVATQQEKL